jgi:hypothetical protein
VPIAFDSATDGGELLFDTYGGTTARVNAHGNLLCDSNNIVGTGPQSLAGSDNDNLNWGGVIASFAGGTGRNPFRSSVGWKSL